MSHKVQFVLWFIDDEFMKWVVIRSACSKDLYELRASLIEQGVQCDPVVAERIE